MYSYDDDGSRRRGEVGVRRGDWFTGAKGGGRKKKTSPLLSFNIWLEVF